MLAVEGRQILPGTRKEQPVRGITPESAIEAASSINKPKEEPLAIISLL